MHYRSKLSSQHSGTVDTTPQQLVPENQDRRYLRVQNVSSADNIAIALDSETPAVNSAGSTLLAPGEFIEWEAGHVPTNAMQVVSDNATTPAPYTVWEK